MPAPGDRVADVADVKFAAKFAARLTAKPPLDRSYLLDDLDAHMAELVAEADPLVAEETGFETTSGATSRVLSRADWAACNVESMLALLSPLIERVGRLDTPGLDLVRYAYRPVLGAQLGAVLGLLSTRVLGQYDVMKAEPGEVWFVGPNVVTMERRLGFVPRDFRLWIALHELTHRAQFEGNPWLRDHFMSSVRELLSFEVDPKAFIGRLVRAVREPDETPIGVRILGPEQLERFNHMQAFMSVVEGHGNFVMDRIAKRMIPTHERMRTALSSGAAAGGIFNKILRKLLGLDLKKLQYDQGQRFFNSIFEAAGPNAVAACFSGPQALPTLSEIQNPARYLARTQA
jgi:coenzyme F420 biosynthesis associated uncharacterized protein